MSKKNRRPQLISTNQILNKTSLNMRMVSPKTDRQNNVFISYQQGNNLLLHGSAGTGKTYISMYLALQDIFDYHNDMDRLTIVRSVVPTRNMGYLPGSEKQKIQIYEQPYSSIVNNLFGRGDAYEILKKKDMIDFKSTSFVRGMTFDQTIIVVDECQNLNFHELDSIITRCGETTKIVFCGDFKQSDFKNNEDKSGLLTFMSILREIPSFHFFEFDHDDIVRSGIVKDYIIQKEKIMNVA